MMLDGYISSIDGRVEEVYYEVLMMIMGVVYVMIMGLVYEVYSTGMTKTSLPDS